MKKTLLALIIADALALPCLAVGSTTKLMTQLKTKSLETIEITANRSVEDKFKALASIDVFNHDSIEQMQPQSVADLLTRVAGITITKTGSSAHQTSVFIRGSSSSQVLILVNGVRVGSATLGVKDISSIPVQLIERIEVIKGPRAALWGADAMGGVIQIFTRQLAPNKAQLGVKYGSHQTKQGYGAIGIGNKQHHYTLSANVESSQGFDVIKPNVNSWTVNQPDKDGYTRESVALVGTSQFTPLFSLETNVQFDKGTTEIDNAWGGDETTIDDHNLLMRGHFMFEKVNLQLSIANSKDHDTDNQAHLDPNKPNNFFQTQRNQLSGQAQFIIDSHNEIQVGLDWYKENVDSSVNYKIQDRITKALFITARNQQDRLKLEASIRRDAVDNISPRVTYQLGAGYQISKHFFVALNQGTAFKAPTFNELYYPFSGDPSIKSETSKNTELLTRYKNTYYSAEFSIFHTNYHNMIIWEPDISGIWKPLNSSPLMKGIDATFTADIFAAQNRLSLSYVDAKNDQNHKQQLRIPYFSADYNITYQIDKWNLGLELNYQGNRYDIYNSQRIQLASYTLVNLNVNYDINRQLTLFAKLTNLANKKYQQISEHPADTRGFYLTLDYKF